MANFTKLFYPICLIVCANSLCSLLISGFFIYTYYIIFYYCAVELQLNPPMRNVHQKKKFLYFFFIKLKIYIQRWLAKDSVYGHYYFCVSLHQIFSFMNKKQKNFSIIIQSNVIHFQQEKQIFIIFFSSKRNLKNIVMFTSHILMISFATVSSIHFYDILQFISNFQNYLGNFTCTAKNKFGESSAGIRSRGNLFQQRRYSI